MIFPTTHSIAGRVLLALFAILTSAGVSHAQPHSTLLASGGKAAMPIVISPTASDRVKAVAATLADYLGRISGAKFQVHTDSADGGILVSTAPDYKGKLDKPFNPKEITQREDYLLKSEPGRVLLIGATDLAVEHAVWDFLYRLGYRQFFPGEHWEVVPKTPDLKIAVDAREHPDFYTRQIWFTYGTWPGNQKRMSAWSAKNRAVRGVVLNTGHAYGRIISRNKAEFDKHPEYFALVDGKRQVGPQGKFDISNPGLRQLVIDYALQYFEENPDADSFSIDPSDGGGWGDTPEERKIGSVSDRVTLLANEVAEAVNKKYPGKYVGFYAYNFHSPPPSIRVHPQVVVSVATAFIKGGYTVDQLIEGWKKQGATIGIREYYSIIHWDNDLPALARAANPDYMKRTIPHFHKMGGRFMSPESSDNWGPAGLGYYVASRIMWDIKEADRTEAIVDDFLDKSFGPARAPMAEFYKLLTGRSGRIFSEDFLGRMYRSLDAALKLTNDPSIRSRIGDLVLYTRHVELRRNYTDVAKDRQKAYEELIRFSYRIHPTHMAHTLALYRSSRYRKRGGVSVPAEASWQTPEVDRKGVRANPWKSTEPFKPEEIGQMVANGIANTRLVEFEPKSFSTDLVPATRLNLQPVKPGNFGTTRGTVNFLGWAAGPGAEFSFNTRSGIIAQDRGAAQVKLFAGPGALTVQEEAGEDEEGEEAEPVIPAELVATATISPADDARQTVVKTKAAGLHHVQFSRGAGTSISWAPGTPIVLYSAPGSTPTIVGRWDMYFYVPKGTKTVGGYATGPGRVRNGSGKMVREFAKGESGDQYFAIPVEAGEDGKLWKMEQSAGKRVLLTVPPYFARSADELLLPKEVVEADSK